MLREQLTRYSVSGTHSLSATQRCSQARESKGDSSDPEKVNGCGNVTSSTQPCWLNSCRTAAVSSTWAPGPVCRGYLSRSPARTCRLSCQSPWLGGGGGGGGEWAARG